MLVLYFYQSNFPVARQSQCIFQPCRILGNSNLQARKLRDRSKASVYNETLVRPRWQITLFEDHSSLADSHLVTDVIVPLCGFSLSTKQAISDIVLLFYSHLGGSHAYTSVIGIIVRMHEIL